MRVRTSHQVSGMTSLQSETPWKSHPLQKDTGYRGVSFSSLNRLLAYQPSTARA